jgi:hypothetical protein
MKGDKITTSVLMAYREYRAKQLTNKGSATSPSTINRELSLLRNCLRTAAHSTSAVASDSYPTIPDHE